MYENYYKDDDNRPKTLNDKNHQASSQKFKQLNRISYSEAYICLKNNITSTTAWYVVKPGKQIFKFLHFLPNLVDLYSSWVAIKMTGIFMY